MTRTLVIVGVVLVVGLVVLVVLAERRATRRLEAARWQRHLDLQRMAREASEKRRRDGEG